ncbi:Uncharacterised protein [Vibrio cholerae]|uniref:Uncharacterized protein n=1 Tax=Vibrio cholerae TaxID=666 RepID=A0A655PG87_VIBCL|nr:Uncharacterised protein [Vibrio cholerae]CSB11720.1 Uncharacterised protein [Vibrio cholerae]
MHYCAFVLSRLLPARNIRIVIQCGDNHLIAHSPITADRTAKLESQRRHVCPKDNRLWVGGIEQRLQMLTSTLH